MLIPKLRGPEEFNIPLFDEETSQMLHLPDIYAFGTIPYLSSRSTAHLPPKLMASAYESKKAVSLLFESGDQLSPDTSNLAAFRDSLNCDTFRAALWIRDLKVYLDTERGLRGLKMHIGHSCGGTPIRFSLAHPFWSANTLFCWNGYDRLKSTRPDQFIWRNSSQALTISARYRFRLDAAMNFAQWLRTGHTAPYAWVQLTCVVSTGNYGVRLIVDVQGSSVPTRVGFVSGGQSDMPATEIVHHDMKGLTTQDFDAFVSKVPVTKNPGLAVSQSKLFNAPDAPPGSETKTWQKDFIL
jgi:hypothetical protein